MMTEEEALRYFDTLPVEQRLRLMQRMLADMEARVVRARAELSGIELTNPEPVSEMDLTQLELPGIEIPSPPPQVAAKSPQDPKKSEEWADFELPDITGGQAHAVHSLRLLDAAAQYERLLKHYGYVKKQPGLAELARRHRRKANSKNPAKDSSEWADWVAKDQETLDRPKSQPWSEWVVLGDDEGDW